MNDGEEVRQVSYLVAELSNLHTYVMSTLDERINILTHEITQLHTHTTVQLEANIKILADQVFALKIALFHKGLIFDRRALNGQASKHLILGDLHESIPNGIAIETGTYIGGTTQFLASVFKDVITIESNPTFHHQAKKALTDLQNVELILGNSSDVLPAKLSALRAQGRSVDLFYLDAHWYDSCPLIDEIDAVMRVYPDSVILIDDMQIPYDLGYGYDDYGSYRLDESYLADVIERHALVRFGPALASERDTMGWALVKPRGTWVLCKEGARAKALDAGSNLRRF